MYCQRLCDGSAHRRTHHMGLPDVQGIHQAYNVEGHVLEPVRGDHRLAQPGAHHCPHDVGGADVVEPRRFAHVAVVEPDDTEAARREPLTKLLVPGDHLRAHAGDKDQGWIRTVAEALPTERDAVGPNKVFRRAGNT
jgi:hypothetical protein